FNIPPLVANFFGGTAMLIIVGVTLDTMRQVETHLLQRHYDGFLQKGRIKGRNTQTARSRQLIEASEMKSFWAVWRPLIVLGGLLFAFGLVASFIK
ncbi:MAG: preprotein translocase subunit SecY, partial [Opitutales bacterium]|nr:preprotein translocase subunit SecY [Opitutales bacterium]